MKYLKHFLIIIGYLVGVLVMLAALFGIFMSVHLDDILDIIIWDLLMILIVSVTKECMFALGRLQDKIGY